MTNLVDAGLRWEEETTAGALHALRGAIDSRTLGCGLLAWPIWMIAHLVNIL